MKQLNNDLLENERSGRISKTGWMMLIFLFFSFLINFADKSIIGLASVQIMKELDLSPSQWGILGSSFFWTFTLTGFIGGFLTDYFGPKKVLAWITSIWSFVQFMTLFSFSLPYLIITRMIIGAGEGPAYTVSMTAGAKWLPKDKLGAGFTIINLGGNVGVALFMPVLVYVIAEYGWRWGFILTGLMGVIWIILWSLLAKENPEGVKHIRESIKQPSQSKSTWQEISPILRSKNFILLVCIGFSSYWIFSVLLTWLPNYLATIRNMSEANTAYLWAAQAFGQVVIALFSDHLYRKTGSVRKSRVFVLGSIAVTCGILFYAAPMVSSNLLSVAVFAFGVGMGAVFFVLLPAILDSFVPDKHRAKILGTLMSLVYTAGIIGPIITGYIIENSSGLEAGFINAFHFLAYMLVIFGTMFILFCKPDKQIEVNKISKQEVETILQ
ncbi:MFS transporter [Neobacillus kokaensis]|uniref:MFS transporter n=1 Tax=Neobacillus kokaensis TaxID=2759023 RepID=A0ABQ3N8E6_9BACI|nr:MFS transporter [Neobacillus kokaensis]GHH99813.1 MFS transporter [Neobacillus kokaensis]